MTKSKAKEPRDWYDMTKEKDEIARRALAAYEGATCQTIFDKKELAKMTDRQVYEFLAESAGDGLATFVFEECRECEYADVAADRMRKAAEELLHVAKVLSGESK